MAELAAWQIRFMEQAMRVQALEFGEYRLKSGRLSPYFFNAGRLADGAALDAVGECCADALEAAGLMPDVLVGAAYKGIPLACACAMALARRGRDAPFAYNRKEAKQHGEGGIWVGAPLRGNLVIVDDVLTAGTAARQLVEAMRERDGIASISLLVGLDRGEIDEASGRRAARALEDALGIRVLSIVGPEQLDGWLSRSAKPEQLERLRRYQARYCGRQ